MVYEILASNSVHPATNNLNFTFYSSDGLHVMIDRPMDDHVHGFISRVDASDRSSVGLMTAVLEAYQEIGEENERRGIERSWMAEEVDNRILDLEPILFSACVVGYNGENVSVLNIGDLNAYRIMADRSGFAPFSSSGLKVGEISEGMTLDATLLTINHHLVVDVSDHSPSKYCPAEDEVVVVGNNLFVIDADYKLRVVSSALFDHSNVAENVIRDMYQRCDVRGTPMAVMGLYFDEEEVIDIDESDVEESFFTEDAEWTKAE